MIEISLTTNIEVMIKYLKEIDTKLGNMSVPMKQSGMIMLRSIDKNFREQGRPRWQKLSPTTLKMRRKKGRGAKILQDSGSLKGGILFKTKDKGSIAIGVRSGPAKYGKIHQFGGKTRMFGKNEVDIPQRKFLMFQQEDRDQITKIFSEHIKGAIKFSG